MTGEGMRFLLTSSVLLLAISACESLRVSKITTGPDPSIEQQQKFTKVDLVALLDPLQYGRRAVYSAGNIQEPNNSKEPPSNPGLDLIENAFYGFNLSQYSEDPMLRRNRVQDRLISASVINCAGFIKNVHRFKGDVNFFTKSIATGLSTAGALVTGGASQILSGASAAVLGIGTVADEAYLNALTLDVILKGIDTRRTEILATIQRRQGQEIGQYSIQRSVADALEYHSACSVLSGLKEASQKLGIAQKTANDDLKDAEAEIAPTGGKKTK